MGADRADRYLRKFYPWYAERLGLRRARGGRAAAADRPRGGPSGSSLRARAAARLQAFLRAAPRCYSSAPPARGAAPGRGSQSGVSGLWGRPIRPPSSKRKRYDTVARESLITPEGLDKLKQELEQLQTVRRREVAERIKEAREFGDISENSEYDDAKNEQAMLEQRIAQMEERVRRATVIERRTSTRARSRSASRSTSRTRRAASAASSRSSARRRRTPPRRSSPTSRRSARP